ncbi:hypothetical protein [Pseudomonas aeruginosa]|uniref:hypothetical protein n=1 Tax=Pseudomonas aeruginosa TaxID=287 RepID=UPI0029C02476|nr:hypothetical protein [Pseudomonas aeruginosa]
MNTEQFIRESAARGLSRRATRLALGIGPWVFREMLTLLPSPVSASTVRRRLAGGMPLEEALLTPATPPFSNYKRENPDDHE